MELVGANEKQEIGKCGHFSIRGYVAEIRKKDSKICWPFPITNSNKDAEDQAALPPLHVADFRWWGCENCLKKIGAITAATETRGIADHQNKAFKPSTCCNGSTVRGSHVDALKLLSGLQQASREKTLGGRIVDSHITVDLNVCEYNPSLCSDKREKKTAAVEPIKEDKHTSVACDGGAEANVNQAVHRTFSSLNKDQPYPTGEKVSNGNGKVGISFKPDKQGHSLSASETNIACKPVYQGKKNASAKATLTVNYGHSIECCRANYSTLGSSDVVFDKRKQKHTTSITPTQICQEEKPEFTTNNVVKINKQQSKVVSDHGLCGGVDTDKKAPNAISGNISKIRSRDLDESDYESSEDDESHGGKIRKLRSLHDIIKSEALGTPCNDDRSSRDEYTDHLKTECAHLKSERDAFTRIGVDPNPKTSNDLILSNDKGVILDKKKKRKMPQEDYDQVPFKMSRPSATDEAVFKGNTATRDIDSALVYSKLDADSSDAIGLGSLSNGCLIKDGKHEKFSVIKKKNKMHGVEDRDSSLMPWLEGVHRVVRNMGTDTSIKCIEDVIGPSKSAVDTEIGSCPDLVNESARQNYAKKVISSKNEHVSSHVKDRKSSLKSRKERTIGEDHSVVSDVGNIKYRNATAIPFRPQRLGKSSLKSRKERTIGEDLGVVSDVGNIKYRNAAAIPFRPSQDSFAGSTQHDLSHMGAKSKSTVSKKQNSLLGVEVGAKMPQFGSRGFSALCRPEASSGTCNYDESIAQRHPSILKSQFDQTASEMSEQAALDDIPMEIVELMAKNQHERCLSNAELNVSNSYCSSKKTEKGKLSGPTDLTEVLGNEMLRLLHEKKTPMQKPQSSNQEGFSRKVTSTKQKLDGYNLQDGSNHKSVHPNIIQQEQFLASMTSTTSSREKLLGGTRFPVTSPSSRNYRNQNFAWNEDVMNHRCSPTCLPSSEAMHICQNFLRHGSSRDDQHFLSSMIPNCMTFRIHNTQNFVAQSSNLGTTGSQCLELFPKGNMQVNHGLKSPNPNIIHLEKQNLKVGSQANRRADVQHPFACQASGSEYHQKMKGPLEFYPNETIPAMHLLRLMDAGVGSTAPLNGDKSQDFIKLPSFPNDNPHKDFTELEMGKPKYINQPSSDCFLKSYPPGKHCHHFHSVLEDSLRKEDDVRRISGSRSSFSGKLVCDSLNYQLKGKTKIKKPIGEPRGRISNRSVMDSLAISDQLISSSDSMPFSIQSQGREDSISRSRDDVNNKSGTAWPITRSCETEICRVNRNPADFTVPEAGNAYMIGPRDLKRGKTHNPRGRSGLTDLESHKRQRMMKLTSI